MLPQSGTGGHSAQSLSAGVSGSRVHQLPHRYRGRAAAALSRRLRPLAEKDLRGISREQRGGHDDMAVQGQTDQAGH